MSPSELPESPCFPPALSSLLATFEHGVPDAGGPVGVFDSGLGGLSVAREIRSALPHEDLIYVADSLHVPYGPKTPEFILERSFKIAAFLLEKRCKAIVIACNTATASAADTLRLALPRYPVVGMEPAVKKAVAATQSRIVGVLATTGTLSSSRYAGLLGRFALGEVTVISQPAPGLVECVEAGELETVETRSKVAAFVMPLVNKHVDVIVLGCTHYPFLKPIIQDIAGRHVTLIDTGPAVARQLRRRLSDAKLLNAEKVHHGTTQLFTTGDPVAATSVVTHLWPAGAGVVEHCTC